MKRFVDLGFQISNDDTHHFAWLAAETAMAEIQETLAILETQG